MDSLDTLAVEIVLCAVALVVSGVVVGFRLRASGGTCVPGEACRACVSRFGCRLAGGNA